MTPFDLVYPFTAVVGQDLLKRALLLNAVCPALGGVLIAGERGTAKTTLARGLAALLPRLSAVRGCPYHCDPATPSPECPHCASATTREAMEVRAPFVELPLGATEDRVAGSLDIERTLREGKPAFRPGLLAAAHRGVLYIDEVNLLADHLVDLLLDAAASGIHIVERESIAVRHPAQFMLIGTMNPEEGELRLQLADRFGLKVSVTASTDPAERAEVVRRRLAFDADPDSFCAAWLEEQLRLGEQLAAARTLFPNVALSNEQLHEIATICCQHRVEGLRGDLALSRAARVQAALAGRSQVAAEDVQIAAELVLAHRTRRSPHNSPRHNSATQDGERRGVSPPCESSPAPNSAGPESGKTSNAENSGAGFGGETVASPGLPPPVPSFETAVDGKATAPGRGRRNLLEGQRRGQYVRAVRDETARDMALDATLRAAVLRSRGTESQITVRPEDVHRKLREDRTGSLVLFVVDGSGSMGARRRMEAVKAAALGLLADAGRLRDEVAVIAVRGPRAELLLSPTPDVRTAERALTRLPTGGRTPLAHGLALAGELAKCATADHRPVFLVIVSDGKANVPLPDTDGDPWSQALAACSGLSAQNVRSLVIDAEEGIVKTGRIRELAGALSAECLPLAAVTSDSIAMAADNEQASGAGSER